MDKKRQAPLLIPKRKKDKDRLLRFGDSPVNRFVSQGTEWTLASWVRSVTHDIQIWGNS